MKIIRTSKYKKSQHEMDMNRYETEGMLGEDDSSQYEDFNGVKINHGRQYVSVYEVQRAYGGPEEGGWWYDVYSLVDTVPVATRKAGLEVRKFLEEKYKEQNEITGPLSSSKGFENLPEGTEDYQIPRGFAGDASEIAVFLEDTPGENATKERPSYM